MAGLYVSLILLVLVVLVIVKIVNFVRTTSISKEEQTQGVTVKRTLKHIDGLPLADKTNCGVKVSRDGLIFSSGGSDFRLANNQIRAIEVKTDVEIQNITDSSLAQGVVGGLVFGPIGAVIGARAKNKRKKKYEHFLIVNYTNSNGEIAAIVLSAGETPLAARKIRNAAKHLITHTSPISVQL